MHESRSLHNNLIRPELFRAGAVYGCIHKKLSPAGSSFCVMPHCAAPSRRKTRVGRFESPQNSSRPTRVSIRLESADSSSHKPRVGLLEFASPRGRRRDQTNGRVGRRVVYPYSRADHRHPAPGAAQPMNEVGEKRPGLSNSKRFKSFLFSLCYISLCVHSLVQEVIT